MTLAAQLKALGQHDAAAEEFLRAAALFKAEGFLPRAVAAAAQAANFPFCTIEPNVGDVAVPDPRLEKLAAIARSKQIIPTRLTFVDIDAPDYDPGAYRGISYREAMGRIHAITAEGQVLRDVAVFRESYRLVGLGWLYAPSGWPVLREVADLLYRLWARWRLPLARRPNLDQLCSCRSEQPTQHL